MLSVLGLVLISGLACSLGSLTGGAEYTSTADNFSIAFPGGAGDVEIEKKEANYAVSGSSYSKSFDNRSDNFRSYEVQVMSVPSATVEGKSAKEILEIGLNGWEDEPETTVKDITVNGLAGIDSIRSIEVGPAKMTFREVVFWSDKDKKLYIIQIAASKKENASAKEADDFVNSFKLNAG